MEYFKTGNATQSALVAGYSKKNAVKIASENLTKLDIINRVQELRQKAEDASVMNVLERKQRLSEIARAKLTDFMELGQDGSWVNLGAETPQGGAIQEIHSRTEYDENGSKPTVYTSVKLHSPTQAIDLLNKMEKIYSEGNTVNIDNRKIEIKANVITITGEDIAAALLELAKANAIPEVGGDGHAEVESLKETN